MRIENRLAELGLELPQPMKTPGGLELPFPWVRLWHGRAFVSGHGPLQPDGSLTPAAGKVGAGVSEEQACEAARLTGLAILASLRRALGDLDRVSGWLRVFGMVNAAPGFTRTPAVINGFSDLILDLWGPEAGPHARSAIGVAGLPFNIPVEIEAEVAVDLSANPRSAAPAASSAGALPVPHVCRVAAEEIKTRLGREKPPSVRDDRDRTRGGPRLRSQGRPRGALRRRRWRGALFDSFLDQPPDRASQGLVKLPVGVCRVAIHGLHPGGSTVVACNGGIKLPGRDTEAGPTRRPKEFGSTYPWVRPHRRAGSAPR